MASVCLAESDHEARFRSEVQPILESACLSCHNPARAEGELRLDTRQHAMAGGESGPVIVSGKPSASALYTSTVLAKGHDEAMPPDEPALSSTQTERLREWIATGQKASR